MNGTEQFAYWNNVYDTEETLGLPLVDIHKPVSSFFPDIVGNNLVIGKEPKESFDFMDAHNSAENYPLSLVTPPSTIEPIKAPRNIFPYKAYDLYDYVRDLSDSHILSQSIDETLLPSLIQDLEKFGARVMKSIDLGDYEICRTVQILLPVCQKEEYHRRLTTGLENGDLEELAREYQRIYEMFCSNGERWTRAMKWTLEALGKQHFEKIPVYSLRSVDNCFEIAKKANHLRPFIVGLEQAIHEGTVTAWTQYIIDNYRDENTIGGARYREVNRVG